MKIAVSPAAGRRFALAAALLGWLFDGLEMGLFPLVARPALGELLGPDATPDAAGRWYAAITALFLIGAATGGVLFGRLGDRVGRVRALTLSVLVYAGCSGLSAFAETPWQLAGLRAVGALGMGGEWAVGVALVMELWPESARVRLAAAIGAAGNLGYALVGGIALLLNRIAGELPGLLTTLGAPDSLAARLTAHGNWRLLMLVGTLPALLTLLIRLAVPESPKWLAARPARRPKAARELAAILAGAAAALGVVALWFFEIPLLLRLPLTGIGLAAVTICYLDPARRALQIEPSPTPVMSRMLLGAGLSAVPLLATWGGVMWMYTWGRRTPRRHRPRRPAAIANRLERRRGGGQRGRRAARRKTRPPNGLRRALRDFLRHPSRVLPTQRPLRRDVLGLVVRRRRDLRRVLRLATADSAGAVPDAVTRDRAGVRVQLRPRRRRSRHITNRRAISVFQ